jgi:signal transduction histidine kinase
MSKRATFWLAWFSLGVYLLIAIATLLFELKNAPSTWLNDLSRALVLLACAMLGALIASRRPQNAIGWIFCVTALLWGLGALLQEYAVYALITVPGSLPAGALAGVIGGWAAGMGWYLLLTFLLLLFPDGRLPSPRWRFLARLIAGLLTIWTLATLLAPTNANSADQRLTAAPNPIGIAALPDLFDLLTAVIPLALFATVIACVVAVALRFRRARGDEKQQLKWFAYGAGVSALLLLVIAALVILLNSAPDALFYLAVVSIPITAGIAILRYRLYDIDILINRTLVYGILTVIVVGLYVVVVGYLGALFRTGGNLLISLIATGVVALLFQPLRSWLQRGVNRLTYGQRDEPYVVVAQLGRRLESIPAPEAMLPAIIETVAVALKLPYAAIALKRGDELHTEAVYGTPVEAVLTLPLVYQAETIGQLTLGPRQRGETFTTADRRLLEDLARQIGVAAHAVQLTADLQRSRERLVTTREEERRRLRRDLHDGLGSALTSLMLKLDAADTLLDRDLPAARGLLAETRGQMQASITDIRRLVYDLRPPTLDEWGLVDALREQVAHYALGDLRVTIEAPESLPPLSAAVEVAVYRIALEALANVVKHAHATNCAIRLSLSEHALVVEVKDNGVGRAVGTHAGVGMTAMRERAAELGGSCVIEDATPQGTLVRASIPLVSQ